MAEFLAKNGVTGWIPTMVPDWIRIIGGVNIIITDRDAFKAVRIGFEIAAALRKMYPAE